MSKVESFWCHEASNIRCVRESDYARLEQECERLRCDLAVALKVPSVAAMHTYLDTECAKQNVRLAAERDAALKQVEGLRAALEKAAIAMWNSEANMDNEAAEAEVVLAEAALSAKP